MKQEQEEIIPLGSSKEQIERRRVLENVLKDAFRPGLEREGTGVKAFAFCVVFEDGTQLSGCSGNVQRVMENVRYEVGRAAQEAEINAIGILNPDGSPKSCEQLFGRAGGAGKSRSKFRELHPLVARLISKMTDNSVPRSQAKEPHWWPKELSGKYACRTKELGIAGCVAVLEAIFGRVKGCLQSISNLRAALDCDFLANLTPTTRATLEAYFAWLEADAQANPQLCQEAEPSRGKVEASRKRKAEKPVLRSIRPRIMPPALEQPNLRESDVARVYSELLAAGWNFEAIEAAVQGQNELEGSECLTGDTHQVKLEPELDSPRDSDSTLTTLFATSSMTSMETTLQQAGCAAPLLKCDSVDSSPLATEEVLPELSWGLLSGFNDPVCPNVESQRDPSDLLTWGRAVGYVL